MEKPKTLKDITPLKELSNSLKVFLKFVVPIKHVSEEGNMNLLEKFVMPLEELLIG